MFVLSHVTYTVNINVISNYHYNEAHKFAHFDQIKIRNTTRVKTATKIRVHLDDYRYEIIFIILY